MKLTVTGRQLTVSQVQRAAIQKRVARIAAVLGRAAVSAQVIVYRESSVVVCDLTVHARGDHMLHAAGRDRRFDVALSSAASRVTRQAKTLVDRWKSRRKGDEA